MDQQPPHWHAYSYTGRSYSDGQARRGEAPETYEPFLVEDWLRKPARLISETFTDVDSAVDWLRDCYASHVPLDAASFPVDMRLHYSRATLLQERGRDVVLGYYSTGRDYVTRALIACPRPKRHAYSEEPPRCPAPL